MCVVIGTVEVIVAEPAPQRGVQDRLLWAGGTLKRGREVAREHTARTGHSTYVDLNGKLVCKFEKRKDEVVFLLKLKSGFVAEPPLATALAQE